MRRFLAGAAAASLLLMLVASPVLADPRTRIVIYEDSGLTGQSRSVELGNEASSHDLSELGFPGIDHCHGDLFPLYRPGWDRCISSFSIEWYGNDCIQLWTSVDYTGTLIYGRTVRPGDLDFGQSTSYLYTRLDLGSYNDRARSLRMGHWTGTRNAGHCDWGASQAPG